MSHIVVGKGGIFWKEGVDSGSVTLYKTGLYSGRGGGAGGRLWEGRI